MKIKRTALVSHSAQDMFGLVREVLSYPEFLSWCTDAQVHEQNDDMQKASLTVMVAGIKQQFTTINTLVAAERVELRLLEGPFSNLQGEWSFVALAEDGCKISLEMDFEMTTGPMSVLFGVGFGKIANRLLDDFCKRADEVCD